MKRGVGETAGVLLASQDAHRQVQRRWFLEVRRLRIKFEMQKQAAHRELQQRWFLQCRRLDMERRVGF